MQVNQKKMTFNLKAAPFVPFKQFIENAMFNRLERNWVKNNQFIFEDESIEVVLKYANTPFEQCKGVRFRPLPKFEMHLDSISEVPSYASIIAM